MRFYLKTKKRKNIYYKLAMNVICCIDERLSVVFDATSSANSNPSVTAVSDSTPAENSLPSSTSDYSVEARVAPTSDVYEDLSNYQDATAAAPATSPKSVASTDGLRRTADSSSKTGSNVPQQKVNGPDAAPRTNSTSSSSVVGGGHGERQVTMYAELPEQPSDTSLSSLPAAGPKTGKISDV